MTIPLEIHINILPIVINQQAPTLHSAAGVATAACVELSMRGTLLEFDALLGADAGGEGMFDFSHLSYEICRFDQFRGGVAPGDDDV